MGPEAMGTVLDPVCRIAEAPPAPVAQGVQGTVAEQAAKGLGIRPRVTGVEFLLCGGTQDWDFARWYHILPEPSLKSQPVNPSYFASL